METEIPRNLNYAYLRMMTTNKTILY